jgi:hypothetical protein
MFRGCLSRIRIFSHLGFRVKKALDPGSAKLVFIREMENISRGCTIGDFVTILTEGSMQDITVS